MRIAFRISIRKRAAAVLIGFLLLTFELGAQERFASSLIVPAYTFQIPGGDLSNRFGVSHSLGGGYLFKTKSNWTFGVQSGFVFGTAVKDPGILDAVTTNSGFLIDQEGVLAEFSLFERGGTAFVNAGKIFTGNRGGGSGLFVLGGLGFMQHKVFINVQSQEVPQLSDAMRSGYDRLSRGVALSQFVGYNYLDRERPLSFYVGLELIEGFTQLKRAYLFDEMSSDKSRRFDLLFGIKLGWIIPLHHGAKDL